MKIEEMKQRQEKAWKGKGYLEAALWEISIQLAEQNLIHGSRNVILNRKPPLPEPK